jgi:3',5'-cyclic-AMP phosphodiesterase
MASVGTWPLIPDAVRANVRRLAKPIRVGIIADLHHDLMHDGQERLEEFLAAMSDPVPDAIIQLGDFAVPAPKNWQLIDTFNEAHPRSLHVRGNHDTDDGYSVEQVVDMWGMRARYYHEDIGGARLIVLDGNDTPEKFTGKYPAHIGPEQLDWLRNALQSHDGPILVFSHQPLAGAWAIDNAAEVQQVLNGAADRVVLALNGHSHIDDLVRVGNIGYLHVNSASYVWVGSEYAHETYSEQIVAKHPRLSSVCPYKRALFATLTLEPECGHATLDGRSSEWVGKSPAQLGCDKHPELIDGQEIVPMIRSRQIPQLSSAH